MTAQEKKMAIDPLRWKVESLQDDKVRDDIWCYDRYFQFVLCLQFVHKL